MILHLFYIINRFGDLMQKIIINEENLKEKEINTKIGKIYIILVNEKDEVFLEKRHNTYHFIDGYINKEGNIDDLVTRIIKDKTNIEKIKTIKPFLLKEEYISDYPTINDKTLYYSYYYFASYEGKENHVVWKESSEYEYIPFKNLKNTLESNRYDNPRNQMTVKEMIDVIEYI